MRIKSLIATVFIFFILGCKARLVSTTDEFGNQVYPGHEFSIEAVVFSQDGRYLASIDKGGFLIVRDLIKHTQWKKEVGDTGSSGDRRMCLALSPNGKHLVVDTSKTYKNIFSITMFDTNSGKANKVIYTGQSIRAILFDETEHLLCAGWTNGVTEWSPLSGNKIREFKIDGSDAMFTRIALSPDGKSLVAAGEYFYWIWDHNNGQLMYSKNNAKNTQYKESAYLGDGRRLDRNESNHIEDGEFYKELVDRDIVPASAPYAGLMKLTQLVQPYATGATSDGYPLVIGERPDEAGWLIWGEGTKPRWTVNSRVRIVDVVNFPLPPQPIAFHLGSSRVAIGADTYEEVRNSNEILVHKVYVGKLRPLPVD